MIASPTYDQYFLSGQLTAFGLQLQKNTDFWGIETVRSMLLKIDVLRSYLRADDLAGFYDSLQSYLAHEPDRASELINWLFESVGLTDDATWEEFTQMIAIDL